MTVSTSINNWVSAKSGAPKTTKNNVTVTPTTPSAMMALSRERARTVVSAPKIASAKISHSGMLGISSESSSTLVWALVKNSAYTITATPASSVTLNCGAIGLPWISVVSRKAKPINAVDRSVIGNQRAEPRRGAGKATAQQPARQKDDEAQRQDRQARNEDGRQPVPELELEFDRFPGDGGNRRRKEQVLIPAGEECPDCAQHRQQQRRRHKPE